MPWRRPAAKAPLAQATREVITKTMDARHGDDNMSGVVQIYIPDGCA